MYTGDGARGEDHAGSHRLSPAGEDIQGSRQTMMNSPRQVLGRSFSHELPVDVTGKLHRSPTRPVRKDRAEHQTVGGAPPGTGSGSGPPVGHPPTRRPLRPQLPVCSSRPLRSALTSVKRAYQTLDDPVRATRSPTADPQCNCAVSSSTRCRSTERCGPAAAASRHRADSLRDAALQHPAWLSYLAEPHPARSSWCPDG
jgi:hypothetical protein